MPELVFLLVRVGFLALLWLFVYAAIRVVRVDLFGPRVPKAARAPAGAATRGAPARPVRATAKPQGRLPGRLVVTQGSHAGATVELTDAPVTIGRAPDSTLMLDDDYVSTHHARLLPHNGQWILEDLGSTNGTYLEHEKLSGPTPVQAGATVRIGKTVLELRR